MTTTPETKRGKLAYVFDRILRGNPATVTELAAHTNLSRPTVTAILTELQELGLAESTMIEPQSAGRPASQWRLADRAGFVVAVDLLAATALVTVSRLSGEIVSATLSPVASVARDARTQEVTDLIGAAVSTTKGALGVVRAVTVSTTGTIDAEGRILRSTLVPEWTGHALGPALERSLGVRVRIENDINCAAFGEFTARCAAGDLTPDDDLIFVQIATGMVTGLVIGGSIHRGIHFNAGEFGLRVTGPRLSPTTEDEMLQHAWQSIGSIAAVIDPASIVISSMVESRRIVERLRDYIAERLDPTAPTHALEASRLGEAAANIGALALALGDAHRAVIAHDALTPSYPQQLSLLKTALRDRHHNTMDTERPRNTGADTLRIGVVGVGARSTILKHVELPQNRGKVVAACDPLPDTAERLRSWTGLDPHGIAITHSLDDFIAVGMDAAVITSPDDTHAEIAIRLLEAGIAVYLEKPMAIELDGATAILETAHRTGTRLYVGHNMRHMDVVRSMRNLIRQGAIGEVKAVWCRHFVGHGGDFYFKDWHADRRHSNGLLLQKAAHDLDVMNWLTDSHATRVTAMGGLTVYGQVADREDRSGQLMHTWLNHDNWPPLAQKGLNPVVDVEDLSMLTAEMASGAFISYQQCHYTPDYWRNYTVIGTEGRLENFGDGEGGVVKLWNRRTDYNADGDAQFPISGDAHGHHDADISTISEFMQFVRTGQATDTSPLGAWYAAATAIQATSSLRNGSVPMSIPELPADLIDYFQKHQMR